MTTSVVFSHGFPGRYALTVLAGALEATPELRAVRLEFPRQTQAVIDITRERLEAGDTVVVAFSFYSPSFPASAAQLRAMREALGRRFLAVAGGVHATVNTREVLEAGFDLVCVGEGERPFVELLRAVQAGDALDALPAFARLVDGREVRGPREPLQPLDTWPPFAPLNRFFGAIEITRGCIYACRFCQTPFLAKARFRHRSIENVRRWVRTMREAGKRDVRFISPTSLSYGSADETVNLGAVEALLQGVREEGGPEARIFFGTFPSEVRPEHVTPEAIAVLKRFVHNDNLIIGGQSGSQTVLDANHRGHGVDAIIHAVEVSVAGGMVPNVDFILGLPGETRADTGATIALMERLMAMGAKVHGHTFMPLPGTPFANAAPGQLAADARAELERLTATGRLYGQWQHQLATGQALAARRDGRLE